MNPIIKNQKEINPLFSHCPSYGFLALAGVCPSLAGYPLADRGYLYLEGL